MMCKRLLALVLTMLLLPLSAVRAETTRYALLHDRQNGACADAVAVLQRYALYASLDCDYLDAWNVTDLSAYDGVILCIGEEQVLPEQTAQALREAECDLFILGGGGLGQLVPDAMYASGDVMLRCPTEKGTDSDMLLMAPGLWLVGENHDTEAGIVLSSGKVFVDGESYPLCRKAGRVTHFAWFSAQEPLLCAQLAACLQAWQWPYESAPTVYSHYIVLEYAYPFLDPADLMARTDMLRQEGVPFTISVTPIFSNGDYPAMKRFCELLRYEQSRGTGVIIRVPFVSIGTVSLEELVHHMDISYEAYASYGVYPLGVQAPVSWMTSSKGLEVLRGYRTVFLFETEEDLTRTDMPRNIAYADGHQLIAPAWSDHRAFTSSYAQAIYLDAEMDLEEMRTQVQRLKESRRVFKALGSMENAVYSGDFAVLSDAEGAISVNGVRQDLRYTPFTYDENYTFDRGFTQYLKEQIETSNQWVMLFVIVSCTIFIAMMFLFRRQIRRELVLGKPKRKMQQPKKSDSSTTTQA